MAGFQLKKNLNEVEMREVRISSQAYTDGDAVMTQTTADAIDVVPATSSATVYTILGVAAETVTSAATELLIRVLEPSQVWECEVANTVTANDQYQLMVLSDKDTVNNTHSTSAAKEAVFKQVGVLGAKGLFSPVLGGPVA